jgi:23S rRNA pseudouridine1911/1915/1917 synthase
MRLDQAAACLFPDFSRGQLQKWLRSGALRVDGARLKVTHRMCGGENLVLRARAERLGEVRPQDIALDLIHADEHLLVINKPAGLVVHPAAGNPDGTLQNALLYFDAALSSIPRAGIVHRLDKDTTGLMVVARTLEAHNSLVSQLQQRTVSRIYEAVAIGETGSSGTIRTDIGRHPVNRKKMAVVPRGKPAITHYRRIRQYRGFSHLEVSLETGRTHQIRVHMHHIGHPLVGDPLYGRSGKSVRGLPDGLAAVIGGFGRQALHAFRLSFVHPRTGEPVRFRAERPADLQRLLDALDTGAPWN